MKNTEHFTETNPRTGNAQQDNVGDCVTRSIVIALNLDYKYVYSKLSEGVKRLTKTGYILKDSDGVAPKWVGHRYYPRSSRISARNGVNKRVFRPFIKNHGMDFLDLNYLPRVIHFNCETLSKFPKGTFIIELDSFGKRCGHLTCVKDNVIYDSWDCATSTRRKYYIKAIHHNQPNLKDIVKSWL
tara:strand:+ start:2116 stop:2670 length:555 start_codon:yes stop_codon:yes gene_type:complete